MQIIKLKEARDAVARTIKNSTILDGMTQNKRAHLVGELILSLSNRAITLEGSVGNPAPQVEITSSLTEPQSITK